MRKKRKLSKKEKKAFARPSDKPISSEARNKVLAEGEVLIEKGLIEIEEQIQVAKLASLLKVPVSVVIKTLMKSGVLATINQSVDWETASIAASDLGFEVKLKKEKSEQLIPKLIKAEKEGKFLPRPPVVTIMGHIDHGKTALLSAIRKIDMLKHEAGGITQSIGAYQVEHKGKKITFIDTPGHEAFEAMRQHGANITDIVVLVIAADEGIKPQTVEAIKHAKNANVAIIVAINKIDLPNANVLKIKNQLTKYDLTSEEMGGKTVVVEISAKQNKNLDELLEMILLISEIKNFKANFERSARGVVIEAHLDVQSGPVASVLIQDGILKTGDYFVTDNSFGKVRFMEDEYKERLKKATPSGAVLVAGFKELPGFGENFQVVSDEKTARSLLGELKKRKKSGLLTTVGSKIEISLVVKADVIGSLKAITDNLKKVETADASFEIIREGIGNISEDDVMAASNTSSTVIGFKVDVFQIALKLAEEKKVKILRYDIIYELIDGLREMIEAAILKDQPFKNGTLKVLKIFRADEEEKVIGGKIIEGFAEKGNSFIIKRDAREIGKGRIKSLQVEKEKVEKIKEGFLGGLGISTEAEIQEGDLLDFYTKLPSG